MKLFFIVAFLIVYLNANAQTASASIHYKNTPFIEILNGLEKKFNVKFAYNTTQLKKQYITCALKTSSLEGIIETIEKNYPLVFNQIDTNFYSVKILDKITFCGYVKNGINGKSIHQATIISQDKTVGTSTDKNGFFSIKNCKPTDIISISFLGYKTIHISLKLNEKINCNTYILPSKNYALNEVVIKKHITTAIVKAKDGSLNFKLNSVDILAGLPEPDVLQSIQLLPGIESLSETASDLYIRGGTPDQNLILWDGIKMYNSNHFFGMLSIFNPYITDHIKIYKSGVKPKYGDRIAGIIDIETQSKTPKKTTGSIGLNMTHGNACLKIPISKKIGIIVSARKSIPISSEEGTLTFGIFADKAFQNTRFNMDFDYNPNDDSKENASFYFYDYTFKILSNTPKNRFSFSSIYTKNRLKYNLDIDENGYSFKDSFNIYNKGMSATWERNWTQNLSSKIQLYNSIYDFSHEGKEYNYYLKKPLTLRKENHVKELGIKMHSKLILSENFTQTTGYQFFSTSASHLFKEPNTDVIIDAKNGTTHAFYTGIHYSNLSAWNIDLGMRADYYSSLKELFIEPRFHIEYQTGNILKLRGSAEKRNQSVSQIMEFSDPNPGLENQIWVLAHREGVPILKSDQLTLGFSINKNGWKINTDFYYKNINGFTTLTKGFKSPINNDLSKGNSTIRGIDILLKKKINNYTSWIGYTYATNNYTFENINQGNPFHGNNDITHSLTWSQSYTLKKYQFSLGWKYRTGAPYTDAIGIKTRNNIHSIEYAPINSKNLPDYHRLDFSVLYHFNFTRKINSTKGEFGFSVLNIYNKSNILNTDFYIPDNTDSSNNKSVKIETFTTISLGLNPNFFFRFYF